MDCNNAVREQIAEQLTKFVNSWHQRGTRCRLERPELPPVHIEQSLAAELVMTGAPRVDIDKFSLIEPTRVGYVPAPLNFHCSVCGLLHFYLSVDDFSRKHKGVEERVDCTGGVQHRWRQLDVFFQHWSGSVEPLYPSRSCACGANEHRLHKSLSGVFSDWKFQCADCGTFSNLMRHDAVTREIFKQYPEAAHDGDETSMIPVSYRSTSVHYPQMERFIPHNDLEMVSKLQPRQEDALALQLMAMYSYPNPPLDDAAIEVALAGRGMGDEFEPYATMKREAGKCRDKGNQRLAAVYDSTAQEILQGLIEKAGLEDVREPDPLLNSRFFTERRRTFSSVCEMRPWVRPVPSFPSVCNRIMPRCPCM